MLTLIGRYCFDDQHWEGSVRFQSMQLAFGQEIGLVKTLIHIAPEKRKSESLFEYLSGPCERIDAVFNYLHVAN